MIQLQQDVFFPVIDAITRGGVATAARAIDAAIATHGADTTRIHRAFAEISRGAKDLNAGRLEAALKALIPALDELEHSAYSQRLGWMYSMIGFAVGMMGNPERGQEWTARAVSEVGRVPASVNGVLAYNNHGCLLGMVGQYQASKDMLEQALDLAIQERQPNNQYVALVNIAYGLLMQLQEEPGISASQKKALAQQALKYARKAQKLGSSQDAGLEPAVMESLLGQTLLHTGDVPAAIDYFTQALQIGIANPTFKVEVHIGLAMALRLSGQWDDAREHLRVAERIATQSLLGQTLDRVLTQGILLETAAGDLAATLDWTSRRCDFLERHYKHRLRLLASSTELANQVESVSRNATRYQEEASALRLKTRDWDDAAMRDSLTLGLNRRGLGRVAGHIFAPFRPLAVLVLDIDNINAINAAYGRTTSDRLLQHAAAVIQAQLREADQFARTEGGEFQLLLLDTTQAGAQQTAEHIRHALEKGPLLPEHPQLLLELSIGICNRTTEKTFEAVLAGADLALDQSRKAGKKLAPA